MMATPRLTFLYPPLFRLARVSASITTRRCRIRTKTCPARANANFATSARRTQRLIERHGKAVEPFLTGLESKENTKVFLPEVAVAAKPEEKVKSKSKSKVNVKATGKEEKKTTEAVTSKDDQKVVDKRKEIEQEKEKEKEKNAKPSPKPDVSSSAPLSQETQDAAVLPGDTTSATATIPTQSTLTDDPSPTQQAAANVADSDTPLKEILHMAATPEHEQIDSDIPHMHAPPYVHHFDSYTLVKGVADGGFTSAQAVTSMKGVRSLLAHNLDIAREGLVSKYDVENETYLFRAACSELRTEIQNTRKASDEKMRQERTLLQHEVDILNQKMTQELLTLKDELKGMFDDRKMGVRFEQRHMDSAIQELNYKITVALNSDAKSEVEGLRWVLTRRSVMAILFMAFMVLSSLRYASYRAHEEELRHKRAEEEARKRSKVRMVDGGSQTTDSDGELVATTAAEALASN